MYELASVGDLPLPQASPAPSHKRERDSDSPGPSAVSVASDPSRCSISIENRTIAGNRRVSKEVPSLAAATFAQPSRAQSSVPLSDSDQQLPPSTASTSSTATPSFALPLHTEELGRLPLHPGFNVSYAGDWQHQPHVSSIPTPTSSAPSETGAGVRYDPSASGLIGAPQFDPRLMAMYNLQPPSGFGQMFGGAAPSEPSPFATQLPGDMQAMAAGGGGGSGARGVSGPGGMSGEGAAAVLSSEELAFADNTLAMWSTAPTGFE